MPSVVYKICDRKSWEAACQTGSYAGSQDDVRDGYIHLSTASQVRGTLEKHFAGQDDLLLITLDVGELGAELRWEPSRNEALFPHLYAPLPVAAALAVAPLLRDQGSRHELPADLMSC